MTAAAKPTLMQLLATKKASLKKIEKTVKLKAGANRVRILPGWRSIDKDGKPIAGGDETFWHEYGQHFVKDATDTLQAVYLCTQATYDRPCEVCAALAVAGRSASDDETQKVLSEAKANRSTLVNALMLDSSEPNTPVILDLKYGVFSKVVSIIEECEGSPLDPEAGQIIIMTREGVGKLTKYDAQVSLKTYKVPQASLAKIHNLDEYVKQESDEQQRRAIAAVNNIVGLLPAPGAGGDKPATSAARLAGPAGASDGIEDVPDLEVKAAVRADVALDTELDDLLGEL